mgnify:CR=1 FL=1
MLDAWIDKYRNRAPAAPLDLPCTASWARSGPRIVPAANKLRHARRVLSAVIPGAGSAASRSEASARWLIRAGWSFRCRRITKTHHLFADRPAPYFQQPVVPHRSRPAWALRIRSRHGACCQHARLTLDCCRVGHIYWLSRQDLDDVSQDASLHLPASRGKRGATPRKIGWNAWECGNSCRPSPPNMKKPVAGMAGAEFGRQRPLAAVDEPATPLSQFIYDGAGCRTPSSRRRRNSAGRTAAA